MYCVTSQHCPFIDILMDEALEELRQCIIILFFLEESLSLHLMAFLFPVTHNVHADFYILFHV